MLIVSGYLDILFELEKRIDVAGLSVFQGRLYGRVSETFSMSG